MGPAGHWRGSQPTQAGIVEALPDERGGGAALAGVKEAAGRRRGGQRRRGWVDPAMGIPDPRRGRVGDVATTMTASTTATFMAAVACCERERASEAGEKKGGEVGDHQSWSLVVVHAWPPARRRGWAGGVWRRGRAGARLLAERSSARAAIASGLARPSSGPRRRGR